MSDLILPNAPAPEGPAQVVGPIKLTLDVAQKIGGALARLKEIGTNKIVEASTAAERRGLEQFIFTNLGQHADEFLMCWFLVRGEYEPLCQAFNALLRRSLPKLSIESPKQPEQPLVEPGVIPADETLKDSSLGSRS